MHRDKTIDRLRGFAMFWVIVVHVLYWGGFFANDCVNLWKSFCLFEMPLFFFITGASNSFSKTGNYFTYVIKRFQRILIPYWTFAIICAALSIVKFSMEGSMDLLTAGKTLLSWLVLVATPKTSVSYLTWALWFIPVYLCVVLIIPVLKWMKESRWKIAFGFALVVAYALICQMNSRWVQNVAFYSFWTYIGLFYSDIKGAVAEKKTRRYFLYLAAAGAVMLCVLGFAGQSLDMQTNKFPPNLIFFVFSVMMMALVIYAIPCLDRFLGWLEGGKLSGGIFRLYATRSMSIYLYQVFAFNLTIRLSNKLLPWDGLPAAAMKAVFCLAATTLVCAGLAAVFGGIEKLEVIRFGNKQAKA